MLKKPVIITISISLLSLLLTACGTDQRYRREVNGNENYLDTTPLQKLVVPAGVTLPVENTDYYVYNSSLSVGAKGSDVDIRVPSQPIATLDDSFASYKNGVVALDASKTIPLWNSVVSFLQSNNIAIESNDGKAIKTGPYLFARGDEPISYETQYLIHQNSDAARQFLYIELISLKKLGQTIDSSIESQRYTVDFFNMMMLDFKKREMSATSVSELTK